MAQCLNATQNSSLILFGKRKKNESGLAVTYELGSKHGAYIYIASTETMRRGTSLGLCIRFVVCRMTSQARDWATLLHTKSDLDACSFVVQEWLPFPVRIPFIF